VSNNVTLGMGYSSKWVEKVSSEAGKEF
jgi:hypothetical protein